MKTSNNSARRLAVIDVDMSFTSGCWNATQRRDAPHRGEQRLAWPPLQEASANPCSPRHRRTPAAANQHAGESCFLLGPTRKLED